MINDILQDLALWAYLLSIFHAQAIVSLTVRVAFADTVLRIYPQQVRPLPSASYSISSRFHRQDEN